MVKAQDDGSGYTQQVVSDDSRRLQALRYKPGQLLLLDQTKLPLQVEYLDVADSVAGWSAIRNMVVRGAPAIAIAAALSLAVELTALPPPSSPQEAVAHVHKRLDYLVSSRPTAVNLSDAASKLKEVVTAAVVSGKDVYAAYVKAAEEMMATDVAANRAIGSHGAKLLIGCKKGKRLRVLTHCNTGSLATSDYGTALGVIRALHAEGELDTAFCTETRPYNQGSRLTAFELTHDKIPGVLIADSAAASLMKTSGHDIDAVVVGADRIAANGDTANKIGTYGLALSAFHAGVPFYVAAPVTSVDLSIDSGKDIIIEQRDARELTHSHGGQGSQVAASGIQVWNPAFDVTPASLITAIITDIGVVSKEKGSDFFNLRTFLQDSNTAVDSLDLLSGSRDQNADGLDDKQSNQKFQPLQEERVPIYVESVPTLASLLGGTAKDWKVKEVGDGNLNFVYIVLGPKGSFVLKQALPYVRCVGESWKMTIERAYFEATALRAQALVAPEHVPEVFHFDHPMAITVMRYLEPPHIILRKGLIAGTVYPHLAEHMSGFIARTLYHSSLLALSTTEYKAAVAQFCGNVEMCRLTEQVIFSDPYMTHSNNEWTSPQLDEDVAALQNDDELKLEIAQLKVKFISSAQARLHGDLHTGSIMVTESSTQVIDPEFAFYGPMGFDLGAFIGNLFLSYCSQDGHGTSIGDRDKYKSWLLQTVQETWDLFAKKFTGLWNDSWDSGAGDAYLPEIYNSPSLRLLAQKQYMGELLQDTVGFAAAKMIRRIVGIAHVEDLESIEDADLRARCERKALNLAKSLLRKRRSLSGMDEVLRLVEVMTA